MRLALLVPSPDTDMAALEGFLHAEGPCLYIVGNDESKDRTLPAFSFEEVQWDERTRTLRARGSVFALGEKILFGGSTATNPALLEWREPPDPACDVSDVFVVGAVNHAAGPTPH